MNVVWNFALVADSGHSRPATEQAKSTHTGRSTAGKADTRLRLTTGVQLLARALLRVLAPAGLVTVSCNGMLGGAPGALLKRPSREAPAGNRTPVGPIRLPEL